MRVENKSLRTPWTLMLGIGLFGVSQASVASLVYGTLSNFDVYNDTDSLTYGFEIELDDIASTDIRFTFANPHYGSGQKIQQGTTAVLRYAANYNANAGTFSASTAVHAPGGPVATTGHACVFAEGCEHYGLGLYAQPTATRYHWLVEDPLNAGSLVAGPAVSLMAPIWAVAPPQNVNNPPRVDVVVDVPEFEQEAENEKQFPDAVWAKIIKIELEHELPLDDLLSDNAGLFANPDVNQEVETEWDLIEKGGNPIEKGGNVAEGAKQIIRRIETYKYIGPVTDENEPDCDAIDCDNPVLGETLGDLIGANIAAVNLEQVEVNPVPLPGALWLLGSALLGVLGMGRRSN